MSQSEYFIYGLIYLVCLEVSRTFTQPRMFYKYHPYMPTYYFEFEGFIPARGDVSFTAGFHLKTGYKLGLNSRYITNCNQQ